MKDEIKEILDRLERIDHKEYSGGFEFADSSTFNEMARCFEERKKMADYITNLQQENQELNDSIIWWNNRFNAVQRDYEELKQENERLKKQLEYLRTDEYLNQVKWERNFNETMNKELKSRIEKAVEYLDTLEIYEDYDNYLQPYYIEDKQNNVLDIDYLVKNIKNILNGRSDE